MEIGACEQQSERGLQNTDLLLDWNLLSMAANPQVVRRLIACYDHLQQSTSADAKLADLRLLRAKLDDMQRAISARCKAIEEKASSANEPMVENESDAELCRTPTERRYAHGELSFGEEWQAKASQHPGPRCIILSSDHAGVAAAQRAEAGDQDLETWCKAHVAQAALKDGSVKMQWSAVSPASAPPSRLISMGFGIDHDGRFGYAAGGFPGTPEELRDAMRSASPEVQHVFEGSEVVYLPGGWQALAHAVDGPANTPSPIHMFRPREMPARGDIPLHHAPIRYYGDTGPRSVPLFPGGLATLRIGSSHRTFYVRDYAHLICLIALFGALWWSLASAAPQSSPSDTGVAFDRHGIVVARGALSNATDPGQQDGVHHSQVLGRLTMPSSSRGAHGGTLSHATDPGQQVGVHHSRVLGRLTVPSGSQNAGSHKQAAETRKANGVSRVGIGKKGTTYADKLAALRSTAPLVAISHAPVANAAATGAASTICAAAADATASDATDVG